MGADSSSTGPEPSVQAPRGSPTTAPGASTGVAGASSSSSSSSSSQPPAAGGKGAKPVVLYPILAIRQPNATRPRRAATGTGTGAGPDGKVVESAPGESERARPLALGGADGGSGAVEGGSGSEAAAAAAGSAPLKARKVSCRSCVGLSLMTR